MCVCMYVVHAYTHTHSHTHTHTRHGSGLIVSALGFRVQALGLRYTLQHHGRQAGGLHCLVDVQCLGSSV